MVLFYSYVSLTEGTPTTSFNDHPIPNPQGVMSQPGHWKEPRRLLRRRRVAGGRWGRRGSLRT